MTKQKNTILAKNARQNNLKKFYELIGAAADPGRLTEKLAAYTFFMSQKETKNAKTGAIPNVYSNKKSCPVDCPFMHAGCYARQGHCNLWFDVAGGKLYRAARQPEAKKLCIDITELKNRLQELPAGIMARHNVAGDVAVVGTNKVNSELLAGLVDAYDGLKGYTYTHCSVSDPDSVKALQAANKAGFTVNKSCEKLKDVYKAKAAGIPAVLAVEKVNKPIQKKNGVLFVQCPAQVTGGKIDCKHCTACANSKRAAVVVFELHGSPAVVEKTKKAGFLIKEF